MRSLLPKEARPTITLGVYVAATLEPPEEVPETLDFIEKRYRVGQIVTPLKPGCSHLKEWAAKRKILLVQIGNAPYLRSSDAIMQEVIYKSDYVVAFGFPPNNVIRFEDMARRMKKPVLSVGNGFIAPFTLQTA